MYSAETSIELRSHYLALAEATPVVLTAESGDDVEIKSVQSLNNYLSNSVCSMMFEAQPKPMFGEINWQIRKGDNSELIIPVKVKLFKTKGFSKILVTVQVQRWASPF